MDGSTGCASARHHIVLFTTCDLGGGRQQDLLRLLGSITRAVRQERLAVRHYILLQRAVAGVPPLVQAAAGPQACLLTTDARVPLSRARNLLLARARADGALAAALWVAFPDDDAWYPPGLLREVTMLFANSASLALVTCGYGARPVRLGAAAAFRPLRGCGELIRTVSSNTLMLRASAVEETGGFDERLGLGARISGGEDLDYALRAALSRGAHAVLSELPLVGHRDRLPWVRSRYFAGSLFALARAARSRPSLAAHVLRKLLVGVALVALRELSPGELHAGIRTGLSGWRMSQPEIE